ncbi:MAG: orotate phosphoribosyltransferase [Calditrichia bacterium]|nr:orotate phosphoribosyltransferase [Calditrichia bacterium]
MNQQEILKIFEESGALLNGHFKLTSGLHSASYFQCAKVLQFPQYAESLSKLIVDYFADQKIDTVISPAIGGIVVGQEVGRQLGVKTIFSERQEGEMKLRRGFTLNKDEKVLVCEDVVTTGGSVFEVIDLVKSCGAIPIGIGFIVDRSNGKVNFNTSQFSCMKMDVQAFKPDECQLCKTGVLIEKPGSRK